ncbi:hypothetical protein I7I48_11129 [Histoplasma ohiense]|nr:hypothetical protein I7I48_11129 [Histoplasma ohiense (nom. inval.)]
MYFVEAPVSNNTFAATSLFRPRYPLYISVFSPTAFRCSSASSPALTPSSPSCLALVGSRGSSNAGNSSTSEAFSSRSASASGPADPPSFLTPSLGGDYGNPLRYDSVGRSESTLCVRDTRLPTLANSSWGGSGLSR